MMHNYTMPKSPSRISAFIWLLRYRLGFAGAKFHSIADNGNIQVRLLSSTVLGNKNEIVEVGKDRSILYNVSRFGYYDIDLCRWLYSQCGNTKEKIYFLDIGANTGVISKSVFNLDKTKLVKKYILIEPITGNLSSIVKNLGDANIEIFSIGLGATNEKANLLVPFSAQGSATLRPTIIQLEGNLISVEVRNTKEFFNDNLPKNVPIIMKIDVEGSEIAILRNIPLTNYLDVIAMAIEIQFHQDVIESEILEIISLWYQAGFKHFFWSSLLKEPVPLGELVQLWTSGSNDVRNVYITRSDN